MSLSSAKNYALRAERSQDAKEAADLLAKAILELGWHYAPGKSHPKDDATVVFRRSVDGGMSWVDEVAPPQWKFTVEHQKTEEVEKEGNEKIAKGDFSGFVDLIRRCIWGEGYGGDYSDKLDNEILGVKVLDDAGAEAVVKEVVG